MICTFPDCGREATRGDYCRGHKAQLERGHELRPLRLRRPISDTSCLVDGCEKPRGRGTHCSMHRMRLWRHADPDFYIPHAERAFPTGPAHHGWQTEPDYFRTHRQLRTLYGPASDHPCDCGSPAEHWAYIGHREPDDLLPFGALSEYLPMCARCHSQFDHEQTKAAS